MLCGGPSGESGWLRSLLHLLGSGCLLTDMYQQAGLAAYFLSHPDYQEHLKYSESDKETHDTVGRRMKKLLKAWAYQRVPDDQKLDPAHMHEYDLSSIPEAVDVIYNGIHGPQK